MNHKKVLDGLPSYSGADDTPKEFSKFFRDRERVLDALLVSPNLCLIRTLNFDRDVSTQTPLDDDYSDAFPLWSLRYRKKIGFHQNKKHERASLGFLLDLGDWDALPENIHDENLETFLLDPESIQLLKDKINLEGLLDAGLQLEEILANPFLEYIGFFEKKDIQKQDISEDVMGNSSPF
ncbi:MAG TPA: hypothetical protein VIY47_01220 [Ignavibacteriaceae bacterium]